MQRLPKKRKRPGLGMKSGPQIRCALHLQFVRQRECAVKSAECFGRIEAAHVRGGTDGAMGVKPGDNWSLPLCSHHHEQQHQIGETSFEGRHGIDMKEIAEGLWAKSPHSRKFNQAAE